MSESQEHTEEQELTFEELYKLYGERILNLAYTMTGGEDTARDLTQDVFMKAFENMDSFREQSSPYTWLYRIAVNHILNYLKRRNRYQWLDLLNRSISEVVQSEEAVFDFWSSDSFEAPDRQMERQEREQLVWKLIQQLPAKYRVPLVLQRYEEMGNQEIAAVMDISLSAVESRIHRAKKKLATLAEPYMEDLQDD